MTRKFVGIKDPDIRNSLPALRRAAKRALREGIETGTPVWVIQNGRMVDLTHSKYRKGRRARPRK